MIARGICIVSKDVARLRDFYAEILRVDAEGGDTFVSLDDEGMAIDIYNYEGMEKMAPGSIDGAGHGSYTLEVEVDDTDSEFERIEALGAPIVKPLTTQPWGRWSFWFRDPDGNLINFYHVDTK